MDLLDKLLWLAQIEGRVDIECRFQGSWYVRHERVQQQAIAHIVTAGSGYLWIDGEDEARWLQVGDVVFFPRSAAHVLSNEPACNNVQAAAVSSQNMGAFSRKQTYAQGDSSLHLFCARFAYATQAELIRSLPESMVVSLKPDVWQPLVAWLQQEASQPQLGAMAMVDALSSMLLVWILREYLRHNANDAPVFGILNALRDKRLYDVVQAVSQSPELAWTVEDMAAKATVSRAQLMRLFKQKLDTSPHAFVNTMRLHKAAVLLRRTQDSVLSVALASGFQSETHFGKSFKKYYGCTPGQYRKQSMDTRQIPAAEQEYVI